MGHLPLTVLGWALQAVALFVCAGFVVDCLHWAQHRFPQTPLGRLHQVHHAFFDRHLRFDDSLIGANLAQHRLPEFAVQLLASATGLLLVHPLAVLVVFAVFTGLFVRGSALQGKDRLHQALTVVPGAPGGLLVGAGYHCLHHVFQTAYFSTFTTWFDRLFGTGCQVRGRTVALTGASGAFGRPLKELLEAEGATVIALKFNAHYAYDNYALADPVLKAADILVLAHGAKKEQAMAANCDSFVSLIERFKTLTRGRTVPPEVWAVGSEIEAHPAWGNADLQIYLESKRAFARHARRYFHDRFFVYRHIVPSAFTSPMGPGLISGRFAAAWAWFFIKRGFRYVPVSYTGIALINYFKFVFRVHEAPDPSPDVLRQPSSKEPVRS